MEFKAISGVLSGKEADAVGVLVFQSDGELSFCGLSDEMTARCREAAVSENFDGGAGRVLHIPPCCGMPRTYVAGLGKKDGKNVNEAVRSAAGAVARAASDAGCGSLGIASPQAPEMSRPIAEGVTLGTYRFNKYKTPAPKDRYRRIESLTVAGGCAHAGGLGIVAAEAQNYSRNLCSEPGGVINPATLSDEARHLASEHGATCVVIDAGGLRTMGMNALLAVGAGSETPPRLIHLIYRHPQAVKKIVIVGKGITFDSGGLSLKPGDSMRTMKGDKTGACSAMGAFKAACELKLPVELHVIVGAAENMPSGTAYRPDDVIRSYSGKTIEIDNTDAEGRVTLADTLAYGAAQKPDFMVDMATLTGACAVALGENTAGLFTPHDDIARAMEQSSTASGERLWRLPMDDDFLKKQLKSNIADLVNCGSRYGGAITAAMFLENFVPKDIKWAHLDIAAVDVIKEPRGPFVKGAVGFGVRTLVAWLEAIGG